MSLHSSSIVRSGLVCLLWFVRRGPLHADRPRAPTPQAGFRTRAEGPLTKIEVFPAEIQLTTARDRQSIVVQATFADGITRDVTAEATMTPGDPRLDQARGSNLLSRWPTARRRFSVALRRQVGELPVKVAQATVQTAAQLPARRHAGVHAGRLQYGKLPRRRARQGRISHFALRLRPRGRLLPPDARNGRPPDQPGRARPTARLITKATGAVQPHGRQAVRANSELYQTMHGWIEAGAPNDDVEQIAHGRRRRSLSPSAACSTARARPSSSPSGARYSDGTDRDVTSLAVFLTNNDVLGRRSTSTDS